MDCYHPSQVVASVSIWCFNVFCMTTGIVLPVICFHDRTVYDFQGAMDTGVLETCTCLWDKYTRMSDVFHIRTHFHPMPKGGLCPIWAFPFVKSVTRSTAQASRRLHTPSSNSNHVRDRQSIQRFSKFNRKSIRPPFFKWYNRDLFPLLNYWPPF